MNIETLKNQINNILDGFPQVSLVYMFGSQVSGNVGPMSDLDLAIFCDPGTDLAQCRSEFEHGVIQSLGIKLVDVVALNDTHIELAFNIIADGKLLYQRDAFTRIEFEATILSRHGDYLPVLRQFREQILQGDEYGKRVQRYREAFRRTQRTLGALKAVARKKTNRL